jgi:hypothetical protein
VRASGARRSVADFCFYARLFCTSRYFTENQVDPISVVCGLVQTGLYLDFFYSECAAASSPRLLHLAAPGRA